MPSLESPFLAEKLAGLSRLSVLDSAGQALLRKQAADQGILTNESVFFEVWKAPGCLHGAEHQVFYDLYHLFSRPQMWWGDGIVV